MAEDILNTVVQAGEAGLQQAPGVYGLHNWTVLPGASPGERRPYLLLMADAAVGHDASDQVVEAVFNRRLEQALIYVSRINPAAEGVLIFLARSHYSWGADIALLRICPGAGRGHVSVGWWPSLGPVCICVFPSSTGSGKGGAPVILITLVRPWGGGY